MDFSKINDGDLVYVEGIRDFLEIISIDHERKTLQACGMLRTEEDYSFESVLYHWKKEQVK